MTALLSSYGQLSQEAKEVWPQIDPTDIDKIIHLTDRLKQLVELDFDSHQDFELSSVAFFVEMLREEVLVEKSHV